MAFFNDLKNKAQVYAEIAADKAKDLAEIATDKAKDVADSTKLKVAIMNEKRDLEKNYRAIGEWFAAEYKGDVPDAIRDVLAAIAANKERLAEMENARSMPETDVDTETACEQTVCEEAACKDAVSTCPVCGTKAQTKFCPECGAPMK